MGGGDVTGYERDVDGDGECEATGANVTVTVTECVRQNVTLRITDDEGTTTATVVRLYAT